MTRVTRAFLAYTHHAVSWTMESKPRVATHLYHVCACGFDRIRQRYTSIHLSIHVSLCIKAAVVIHTHGQLCRFLY